MKTPGIFFAIALFAVVLTSCNKEDNSSDSVRFTFKINDYSTHASTDASSARLLLSIVGADGEAVLDIQEVPFSAHGNTITTSALDLKPGNYRLTEFALVDKDDRIIYTIPTPGSMLEKAVAKPLGFDFNVSANMPTDVTAELLNSSAYDFEALGLPSITLDADNSFKIEVSDGEENAAIAAKAVVLDGSDTVAQFSLPPMQTRISFSGDPNKTYQLAISNGTSAPLVQSFQLSELTSKYHKKALKLMLKQAFVMVVNGNDLYLDYPFYFYLGGKTGKVSVNWGDGTSDTYALNAEYGNEVAHTYAAQHDYIIVVSGDVDKIEYFDSFYGESVFKAINFRPLKSLKEIRYGLTSCPKVIDLSANSRLEFAMLPHLADMEELILPKSHNISFIEIDGLNHLNTLAVDRVIDNIYNNSVKQNITGGIMGLSNYWAQEEGDNSMVGPPSSIGLNKLYALRDNLGWSVRPLTTQVRLASESRAYGKIRHNLRSARRGVASF